MPTLLSMTETSSSILESPRGYKVASAGSRGTSVGRGKMSFARIGEGTDEAFHQGKADDVRRSGGKVDMRFRTEVLPRSYKLNRPTRPCSSSDAAFMPREAIL